MISEAKKSLLWGIIGGLTLLFFYFIVLVLANSFSHALEQFQLLWQWISALIAGFSVQVGLYAYIRYRVRKRKIKGITGEIAATGGVSTGSMIACCAHHLVDVLPILGLSAAFLFLAQYQIFFIIFGIVSNVIGIIFMLEIIKKYSLYKESSILKYFVGFYFKRLKYLVFVTGFIVLIVSFFWIKINNIQNYAVTRGLSVDDQKIISEQNFSLPAKINSGGGLSIEVNPVDFSFEGPMQFEISLNTHQGDLDFDIVQQSFLMDNKSNKYFPVKWHGGKGGHHISGILIFPAAAKDIENITLVIRDVYGVKERIFEWNLY